MNENTRELLRTLGKNSLIVGGGLLAVHLAMFLLTSLLAQAGGNGTITFAITGLLSFYLSPYLVGTVLTVGLVLYLSGKK